MNYNLYWIVILYDDDYVCENIIFTEAMINYYCRLLFIYLVIYKLLKY